MGGSEVRRAEPWFDEIGVLTRRDPRELAPPREDTVRRQVCASQEESPPEPDHAVTLISASRTGRKLMSAV